MTSPAAASGWVLAEIAAPPGHPDFVVRAASPDGTTVLFQDRSVFDQLFVARGGTVAPVTPPGHDEGVPIFARLSPSGATIVGAFESRVWTGDPMPGRTETLPPIPGSGPGSGVVTLEFVTEETVAILLGTGTATSPASQLLTLDLRSLEYHLATDRHDGVWLLASAPGPVLVVDASARRDNSGWQLFLVDADGSTRLLLDVGGSSAVVISRAGDHVAFSKGDGGAQGVFVADPATGQVSRVALTGLVESFSPDGTQLAIALADGGIAAFDLADGTSTTLPTAARAAWIRGP